MEAPGAQLAADAAALEAAPGGLDEHDLRAVDPDVADLERGGDALRALVIAGDDGRDQAVVAVVGELDRLVLAREGPDRQHRPEDLLAPERAVLRDVGEDGRRTK